MAALASGVVYSRIPSPASTSSSLARSLSQRVHFKPVGRVSLLVKSSLHNKTSVSRQGVEVVNKLKIIPPVKGVANLVKENDVCPCGSSLEIIEKDYSTAAARMLSLTSPALLLASINNSARAAESIVEAIADSDVVPVDTADAVVNVTISVLLTASFVGLVVLTGGIVYLGFTEWRDKRQLESEAKSIFPPTPEEEVRKPRKARVGPKGFGGDTGKEK